MLDALLQEQSFDEIVKNPNHKSVVAETADSFLQRGRARLAEDEEAIWSVLGAETCVLLGNSVAAGEIAQRYKLFNESKERPRSGVDAWAAVARGAAYRGDFKVAREIAAKLLIDVPDNSYVRERSQEEQSRLYRWLAILAARRGVPNGEFIAGVEPEYQERVRERIKADALPVLERLTESRVVMRDEYKPIIERAQAGDFSGLPELLVYRFGAGDALNAFGLIAAGQKRSDVLDEIVVAISLQKVSYECQSFFTGILLDELSKSLDCWPVVEKYVAHRLTFGAKAVELALKRGGDEAQIEPVEQLLLTRGTDHDKLWELGSVYRHAALEFARRRDYVRASKYAEKKEGVSHAQGCCSLDIFPRIATVAIENGDFDASEPFVARFKEEDAKLNARNGYDLKSCVIALWKKGESSRAEKLLASLPSGTQAYVLFSFARQLYTLPEFPFDERDVPS